MPNPISRRALLATAAVAPFAAHAETPGMIIRQKEPENLEFPFDTLNSFLTPNDRFYVRNHHPVPKLDTAAWKLKVEGAVGKPFELNYAELLAMPSLTVPATLECAGNSRVFLVPQTPGAQWELGAVSTAEWLGVPLRAILDRAGVDSKAIEVALEGADQGEGKNDPHPPGQIHFARSIPLEKAMRPEVLLAYRMNGKELPVAHGFPVRAIVPGFYGMASTKWLTRILVVSQPFSSYWQSSDYGYWDRVGGTPVRRPIYNMQVKSLIARPAVREQVKAGADYKVFGSAWTGDAEIMRVEVSADGGKTWADATLRDKSVRFCWRAWDYTWRAPVTGRYTLMSRATDSKGNTQQAQHNYDYGNYVVHHTVPIDVEVA